ncbi:EAL domain-containing protein [Leucothrix pacifica]|uniref:GGDEF-domain containing protein n=1 Tax=Leucothrix pacifica TaxID=1247513 RepID=A0A317C1H9_9GAMM|nr:EAL domain-containing protein [Leucothrix pacifica]PWQ92475.1 hypothetical protein DKW60_20995 [Leucothrix pacifica]
MTTVKIDDQQHKVKRASIIAFMSVTLLIIVCYISVVYNLRLQNNMLEASSISYELRILLDQSNEQVNLLFDPKSAESFSDRILKNIRDDFVKTTEQVTALTAQLPALLRDHQNTFFSLIPSENYRNITNEIHNIDSIWGQFQSRIQEISTYNTSTLRASNKLWQPIDTVIAHNGSLSKSITSLNHLVYQSSLLQNQRLGIMYTALVVLLLVAIWGIWSFTLKPLASRLKASYQEILFKNRHLDYQANHDALTGLLNRAAFNAKTAELQVNKDTAVPHCLVLIDLDNFKLVNDSLGHNVGDLVLQKITDDLTEDPMVGEYAYRLGGDEFALVIDRIDQESALEQRLETLLKKIRRPLEVDKTIIQCSCSIGAAVAGKGCGYSQKEMFAVADASLYQVKEQGRDGYLLYDKIQSCGANQIEQHDNMLHQSVKNKQFRVSYQPIIDLRSQKTLGFEARIHWHHPTQGKLHHDEWISDATRLTLDSEITRQAIKSITEHFQDWLQKGIRLRPVSVDIGQTMLLSGEAYDLITALSNKLPFTSLIGIEVSEMIFNERSFQAITEQLLKFKAAGIPITIDHYGRGHSSLLQLRKLPFDVLKIDKKLTLKVSYDPSLQTYISALASFTDGMSKKLICQGVQSEKEQSKLTELGCRYMQSRQISTLLSSDSVANILRKSQLRAAQRNSEEARC